jgi:hypothetical protein
MKTVDCPMSLHRRQYQFRQSKALFRGFVAGRGAGKTWVGAYDMIRRARPPEPRSHGIGVSAVRDEQRCGHTLMIPLFARSTCQPGRRSGVLFFSTFRTSRPGRRCPKMQKMETAVHQRAGTVGSKNQKIAHRAARPSVPAPIQKMSETLGPPNHPNIPRRCATMGSLARCEPIAHRFFPSDSASFRFRRFRPTAYRRVLCRPIPLLTILSLPFRHST